MKYRKLLQITMVITILLMLCHGLCLAGLLTAKGSSMEPTIKDGHKIWISNYPKEANPDRGDIIAFAGEQKSIALKRVIGLPDEKVVIKKGIVYIVNQVNPQGEKLDEPYLAPGTVTEPDGEFAVPDGQYFVLGDKRGASLDSRAIGCIPRENVIGRVTKIY